MFSFPFCSPPLAQESGPENPAIRLFLSRLPAELAGSFTPPQLAAIDLHFAARYRIRHALDWRRRFAEFYIVILAGRERRSGA